MAGKRHDRGKRITGVVAALGWAWAFALWFWNRIDDAQTASDLVNSRGSIIDWLLTPGGGALIATVALLICVGLIIHEKWLEAQEAEPVISVVLVIEAVAPNGVDFHLDIENEDRPITELRTWVRASGGENLEVSTVPRSLAPGGRLSLSGPKFMLLPDPPLELIVNLTYKAHSRYFETVVFFNFGPALLAPGTVIQPSGRDTKRDLPPSIQADRAKNQALAGFQEPIGTMLLPIPTTTPDGRPNVVRGGTENKAFLFDPSRRFVAFAMRTASGREINLRLPFPNSRTKHLVLLSWDVSRGARLGIDGVEVADGI